MVRLVVLLSLLLAHSCQANLRAKAWFLAGKAKLATKSLTKAAKKQVKDTVKDEIKELGSSIYNGRHGKPAIYVYWNGYGCSGALTNMAAFGFPQNPIETENDQCQNKGAYSYQASCTSQGMLMTPCAGATGWEEEMVPDGQCYESPGEGVSRKFVCEGKSPSAPSAPSTPSSCNGNDGGCGGNLARGDGDCDKDSDCVAGLKCGKNNCGDFRSSAGWPKDSKKGWDTADDCCYGTPSASTPKAPSTPSTPSTPKAPKPSGHPSPGPFIGGGLVAAIVVAVIVYCTCCKKKKKPPAPSADAGTPQGMPTAPQVQIPVAETVAIPMATIKGAKFDPNTGQPIPTTWGAKFDPNTGQPVPKFDPETGKQNWSD